MPNVNVNVTVTTAAWVVYNASTGIVFSTLKTTNNPSAAGEVISMNVPAGMAAVAVDLKDDALSHPYRYKVDDGVLGAKQPVSLTTSGLHVVANVNATCTVRLGGAKISVVAGSAVSAKHQAMGLAAIPSCVRLQVDPEDPTYYSDPVFTS